ALCHPPAPGQPSPATEAPPPGRPWKKCQRNERSLRGSLPWIATRKRRPQPAIARSGQAGASALTIASMISWPQWLVHNVSGKPSSAHTTVPGLAISSTGRNVPSFFGVSGSIRNDNATTTAEYVLAYEELM